MVELTLDLTKLFEFASRSDTYDSARGKFQAGLASGMCWLFVNSGIKKISDCGISRDVLAMKQISWRECQSEMENEAINRADLIVTALFWISSLPNVLIVAPVADTDASTRKMMTCLIPVRKDRWRFPLFIAGIDACFSKLAAVHSFADHFFWRRLREAMWWLMDNVHLPLIYCRVQEIRVSHP